MLHSNTIYRLRQHGHRLTPQRLTILRVIEDNDGHLSAGEIYNRARELLPGLTEPTVYRTLDFLTQHGLALVTHIGDGRLLYESAAHNHHHLICRDCGAEMEIPAAMLEPLRETIHAQTGFVVECSHITFLGHCPGCAQ